VFLGDESKISLVLIEVFSPSPADVEQPDNYCYYCYARQKQCEKKSPGKSGEAQYE